MIAAETTEYSYYLDGLDLLREVPGVIAAEWGEDDMGRWISVTLEGARRQATWVAEIVGRHPTFVFAREFVETIRVGQTTTTDLYPGRLYEVRTPESRFFLGVHDHGVSILERRDVRRLLVPHW